MLLVSELIGSTDPSFTAGNDLEKMVTAGINRVLSMQTPSGGFGYWPGDVRPHPWASAFGTHFLLDAQKAGYPVPKERIDASLDWMDRELSGKAGDAIASAAGNYHGFTGGSTQSYMLFVMSLAGRPRTAQVQSLLDALPKDVKGANLELKFQLQAALWMAGDRRYEKELKATKLPSDNMRLNDDTFYSHRRMRGFALNTMQDLFGNDPAGEPLAETIGRDLSSDASVSSCTQELIWNVAGLGKRVKGAAASFKPGVLVADGKTVQPQAPKGGATRLSDRTFNLARAGERKALKLELEDTGGGNLYLVVNSEGIRTDGQFRVGGEGLSLSRTWRQLDGTEIDLAKGGTALADLVFVELTLSNQSGKEVKNVALVDRLPAGWEIENPRLSRGTTVGWAAPEEQWQADYMDVRDDKLAVFGSLAAGQTAKVVYAVRAVTAGTFVLPPADASAMYDPSIWARTAGGSVEISGPWADFLL